MGVFKTLLCSAMLCCAVLCCAVLQYCIILCCAMRSCSLLWVLCSAILGCVNSSIFRDLQSNQSTKFFDFYFPRFTIKSINKILWFSRLFVSLSILRIYSRALPFNSSCKTYIFITQSRLLQSQIMLWWFFWEEWWFYVLNTHMHCSTVVLQCYLHVYF